MSGFLIFWIVVSWIVNIILSGWLASEKGRSASFWIFLAVFFPWTAIIALAGAPQVSHPGSKGIPGY